MQLEVACAVDSCPSHLDRKKLTLAQPRSAVYIKLSLTVAANSCPSQVSRLNEQFFI